MKNKKYYIEKAEEVKRFLGGGLGLDENGVDIYTKKKANYDLYNGRMNPEVAKYIIYPIDETLGELPAKFRNVDISSDKIKTLLGIENSRPFNWTVLSVNPEIIQEKERQYFDKVRKMVFSQIESDIRKQVEIKYQEQIKNQELTKEQKEEIAKQIEQETQQLTPDEVKKQLKRKEKHVLEMTDYEILKQIVKEKDIERKFNKAFKHGLLSARSIAYISNFNNNPDVWIVNPLNDFNFTSSEDEVFIENSDKIYVKYFMTPTKVIELFGNELKKKEIDDILNNEIVQSNFWFSSGREKNIQVEHILWREPLRIGFLTYFDEETKSLQKTVVNEEYKVKEGEQIEYEWINEIQETWIINNKYYVRMQPIEGQLMDIYNLLPNFMPYYGIIYDNLNSEETSLADRLFEMQVFYNIIYYKIELLMSSDKGKKLLMNINAIPSKSGVDLKQWMQFFESTPFTFYNSKEAGLTYSDTNQIAKVLDLSLVSDINTYISLANSIKQQINDIVGISRQMVGQMEQRDAVANVRQSIIQSSYTVNSYFDLHNIFKRNVLNYLLNQTKIAYYKTDKKYLSYVLDDLSIKTVKLEKNLLTNFSTGIYVEDIKNVEEVIQTAKTFVQAALNTSAITIAEAMKILKSKSLIEIEEFFNQSEEKRSEEQQKMKEVEKQIEEEKINKLKELEENKHKNKIEEIKIENEEKRKNIILEKSIMASSFNPDLDKNNNGINDYIDNIKKLKDIEFKDRDLKIKEKESELKSKIQKNEKENKK